MCCLLVHGIHDGRIKEPDDQTPEMRQEWHRVASAQIQEETLLMTANAEANVKRQDENKECFVTLETQLLKASSWDCHKMQKYPEESKKSEEDDLKVAKTMANENPLECYYTADFT